MQQVMDVAVQVHVYEDVLWDDRCGIEGGVPEGCVGDQGGVRVEAGIPGIVCELGRLIGGVRVQVVLIIFRGRAG